MHRETDRGFKSLILRQVLTSLLRVIETTAGNRAFWLSYLDEDF
jgi:hypothetical protein